MFPIDARYPFATQPATLFVSELPSALLRRRAVADATTHISVPADSVFRFPIAPPEIAMHSSFC
jgi:hypothetical protein